MRSSAKTSKKLTQKNPDEYTTFVTDRTRKAVGCDLYRAWFPVGGRVRLPDWRTYERVRLLGPITEDGETFFTEVADSFNSDVTIRLLQPLQYKFGEKIHVILDNATYFRRTMSPSSSMLGNQIDASPDRIARYEPVEECWRPLKKRLGTDFSVR